MRHEAAGITTAAFPKTMRLGGIDCAASLPARARRRQGRRHRHGADLRAEPGQRRALRMAGARHAAGQGAGAGEEPAPAAALAAGAAAGLSRPSSASRRAFAQGGLIDALLKAVRERTQLAVQRNDFKLDQLQPHLFMNFRVVDEHGRQLGMGRHLAGAEGRAGRPGALGLPGAGGAEARGAPAASRRPAPAARAPSGTAAPGRGAPPRRGCRGARPQARQPPPPAGRRRSTPPGPSANCPS